MDLSIRVPSVIHLNCFSCHNRRLGSEELMSSRVRLRELPKRYKSHIMILQNARQEIPNARLMKWNSKERDYSLIT